MDWNIATHIERSPLEQIRYAEAEIARRLAATRTATEAVVRQARRQADDLQKEARELGRREGQDHYQELIARAEAQAAEMIDHARRRAVLLRHTGESNMDSMVLRAVATVISSE